MDMSETGKLREKIVLCGANAYEQKYYFNPRFSKIPQSVQDELHIICVLFTREVGGIFTIVFEEDGTLAFETNAADDDLLYDEIYKANTLAFFLNQNKETNLFFCDFEKWENYDIQEGYVPLCLPINDKSQLVDITINQLHLN